jgi:prepilin-type processing-associated H-X9-DG protein/prepilin-type N-terminal cleavage/methylation domain-containing protein
MKRYDKPNGFTLIEILIIVAIITLLAAILLPVFARARENARRASCMSNLKQIGLGVKMYVQDYDERYPYYLRQDNITWQEAISSYTSHYSKSTQLYRCPSSWYKPGLGASEFGLGNYGANDWVFVIYGTNTLALASVAKPSNTYMIMDAGSYRIRYKYAFDPGDGTGEYIPGTGPGTLSNLTVSDTTWTSHPELKGDFTTGRHFGGINVLFADGHVKWLRSHKLILEEQKVKDGLWGGAWNPNMGGQ